MESGDGGSQEETEKKSSLYGEPATSSEYYQLALRHFHDVSSSVVHKYRYHTGIEESHASDKLFDENGHQFLFFPQFSTGKYTGHAVKAFSYLCSSPFTQHPGFLRHIENFTTKATLTEKEKKGVWIFPSSGRVGAVSQNWRSTMADRRYYIRLNSVFKLYRHERNSSSNCRDGCSLALRGQRLYFVDFYCKISPRDKHKMIFVYCEQGSAQDRFCEEHFVRLHRGNNPFICFETKTEHNGRQQILMKCFSGCTMKIFSFIPILTPHNLHTLDFSQPSVSKIETIAQWTPTNYSCEVCNPPNAVLPASAVSLITIEDAVAEPEISQKSEEPSDGFALLVLIMGVLLLFGVGSALFTSFALW